MKKRHLGVLSGIITMLLALSVITGQPVTAEGAQASDTPMITWEEPVLVHNIMPFTDAGPDARGERPGNFGSQFPRMITNGNTWLAAYTIYRNNGYLADPAGGNELQIAKSGDGGQNWNIIATITDPGRDLDNAQLLQLENGDILLACRSVIWHQSYKLDVYKSSDQGYHWSYLSTIDEISGAPGELANPDRGVYEPYMVQLDADTIGVMYASEKYAVSSPAYSQILAMKTSNTAGQTWGEEIWTVYDTEHENARPGMPVWTKMQNGKYILVYEIVGTTDVDVFYKISEDGINWPAGMGSQIPGQKGAPFVLALSSGELVVTSNTHKISVSRDEGTTWNLESNAPFGSLFGDADNLWPALYQTGSDQIVCITSAGRSGSGYTDSGHNIQLRRGYLNPPSPGLDGGCYKLKPKHTDKYLDLDAGSGEEGANIQIWDENWESPQEWIFEAVGNDSYKIVSAHTGKVLTVDGSTAGSNVMQASWTDSESQRWRFESLGDGYYRIRSGSTDLCLDVDSGKSEAGSNVQVWTQNGLEPQCWQIEAVSGIKTNTPYVFLAKHSGKAVEVKDGLTEPGANVQQWESNGGSWQQWELLMDTDGYYSVKNVNSSLCLDVSEGSILNGANIQQWTPNGLNPQKWTVLSRGKGYYTIIAKNSGKCLDIDAGRVENGANIQQWEFNGLDPQCFKIIVK